MLKIHEVTEADGSLTAIAVSVEAGAVGLVTAGRFLPLPDGALDAVVRRFGGPLEPSETVREVGALPLPDGRSIRHVRHLARFDVIARDYVALTPVGGDDEYVALATTVAGAWMHLARGFSRSE